MASLIKKLTSKKEPVIAEKEAAEPLHSPENRTLCECGEPVASEFGQNQVCKKHMRVG